MRRTIRTLRFWMVRPDSDQGRELVVGVGRPAPDDAAPVQPGRKWCEVCVGDAVLVAGERYVVGSISLAECSPPPPSARHRPIVHSGREWLESGKTMPEFFYGPDPGPGWFLPSAV